MHQAAVDEPAAASRLAAKQQVFGYAHIWNRREFLGDDADPVGKRFGRRSIIDGAAIAMQHAAVAMQKPHQHIEEGRLARPIAAAERVDSAGPDGDAPVDDRGHTVEGLGDAIGLKQRRVTTRRRRECVA